MNILQQLYNSEINFSISTFWDGGFDFKLGDEMNGFVKEANFRSFEEGIAWLIEAAKAQYPNSLFTTGKYPTGYDTRLEAGANA